MRELDRVLGIADEAEESKKLTQFQEWDANVHGAIQVQSIVRVISDLVHAYPMHSQLHSNHYSGP